MKSQPVIMLQIAQRDWAINALHAACQMARQNGADVLLVKLVSVQHISWLGTEWGYMDFTCQEQEEMAEYQEMIKSPNVDPTYSTYPALFAGEGQQTEPADVRYIQSRRYTSRV